MPWPNDELDDDPFDEEEEEFFKDNREVGLDGDKVDFDEFIGEGEWEQCGSYGPDLDDH